MQRTSDLTKSEEKHKCYLDIGRYCSWEQISIINLNHYLILKWHYLKKLHLIQHLQNIRKVRFSRNVWKITQSWLTGNNLMRRDCDLFTGNHLNLF